jgi:hypothetical protein
MKDRLNIKTLKVTGYKIFVGKDSLMSLRESKSLKRRYPIDKILFSVYTNQGTLNVHLDYGFVFDGRSGPPIIDWYAPNLGRLEERLTWLTHDVNGYGRSLSFRDTNTLLYAMLRDLCGYSRLKASTIRYAVSLDKSWYGEPKEDDWCHANLNKLHIVQFKLAA